MPSSGAVIHMLCSEELRRPGHRPPMPDGPDRKRTLEGFLNSIWPWGRSAISGSPGSETSSGGRPGEEGAPGDPR